MMHVRGPLPNPNLRMIKVDELFCTINLRCINIFCRIDIEKELEKKNYFSRAAAFLIFTFSEEEKTTNVHMFDKLLRIYENRHFCATLQ